MSLKLRKMSFQTYLKRRKKDVLLVFAAPGSMMIATPSSYIGNLVDKVGANNIVKDDKKPFVSYSNEEIVKLNPEMVLVMTHGMPEQAKKNG